MRVSKDPAGRGLGRTWTVASLFAVLVIAAGCTFPPPLPQAQAPTESERYAIVQPGENVSIIADRTGIPVSAIIQENQLSEPFTVYPGQRLTLPAQRFHRVEQGDTLFRIARRYDVDIDGLAQTNRLQPPYTIVVGQALAIPETPGASPRPVAEERPVSTVVAESAPDRTRDNGQTRLDGATTSPRDLTGAQTVRTDRTITTEPLDGPGESPSQPSEGPEVVRIMPGVDSTGPDPESDVTAAPEPAPAPVESPAAAEVEAEPQPPEPTAQPEPAQPPAEEAAPPVNQQQANLPAVDAPAERSGERFSWPVDGPIISTFGPKEGGQTNDGINIEAPLGTAIRAADNGVVAYAGSELRGFGNLIILRHADGWVTAYGHADRITVSRGQSVSVGDIIGEVGSTGSVSTPQLHFEIRQQSRPVDPLDHLASRS